MPTMTPQTFLGIADRIAAQYKSTLDYIAALSPLATRALLTINPPGTNNSLTFSARIPGYEGNSITVTYQDPQAFSQPILVSVLGTDITVNLATDAGGVITTTAAQLKAAIQASAAASALVTVSGNDDGSGLVTAVAKTNMAGALHGLYQPMVIQTGDPDVIAVLNNTAQLLDTSLNADIVFGNIPLWSAFVTTLASHFTLTGQAGGINGFLGQNDIRVHEYFDEVYYVATGLHLPGANVFKNNVQQLGVITLSGVQTAVLNLTATAGPARATITTTNANTTISYKARTPGSSGNAITVTYIAPGLVNQPLYVEVQGKDIKIHLGTDTTGVPNSTAQQVVDAVNTHWLATALVIATVVGAGTGVLGSRGPTFLTNTNNTVLYTAKLQGSDGSTITIEYADPGLTNQALAVVVNGRAVKVNLATGADGSIVSSGTAIAAAINADPVANTLVTAAAVGDATGLVSVIPPTYLDGGCQATLSNNNPLGSGTGEANNTNFAAQALKVTVTPAAKAATLNLYPANALAFAMVDPVGTNNTVRLDAIHPKYNDTQEISLTHVTGGTFTLTYGLLTTGVLNSNATAGDIQTQLEGLATLGVGNVVVTGPAGGPWIVIFQGTLQNQPQTIMTGDTTGLQGTNEVQQVTVNGGPTGGTFTLSYNGATTAAIAYNAAAVNVQAALTALSTIGTGNAAVAGVAGGPWTVTFQGVLGSRPLPVMTGNATGLLGGIGPAIQIAVTTAGVQPQLSITKVISGGMTGDSLSFAYQYLQLPSNPLSVSVIAGKTTVTLATDATSAITTTAADVITAVNNDPVSSLLIKASPVGTVTGLISGSPPPPPVTLNSHHTNVVFNAITKGASTNNITIEYADPGASNAALSVTVSGTAIQISLATDATGTITTTAADVVTAVNGNTAAAALLTATAAGQADGVVAPVPPTNLAGGSGPNLLRDTVLSLNLLDGFQTIVNRLIMIPVGTVPGTEIKLGAVYANVLIAPVGATNNALIFTAVQSGSQGNNITIRYADPNASNSPISVSVSDYAITVNLATDYTGRVVSTADEVKNAINMDPAASALVTAASSGAGYGYVRSITPTNLRGGLDSQRYYEVAIASIVRGGETGDLYIIEQIPERQISL